MLNVTLSYCYIECLYNECHYVECHCAECHYVECHCAECHCAKCHCAKCHCVKCHYAECHYAVCHHVVCCYAECRNAGKSIPDWQKTRFCQYYFTMDAHFSTILKGKVRYSLNLSVIKQVPLNKSSLLLKKQKVKHTNITTTHKVN
jgi:hypothetical protein